MKKHIIDTSKPWIPDGYILEENTSLGKVEWKPKNISLWLSEEQKKGYIEGNDLKDLVKNPLTSSVLKYLLDNPELIPEDWKGKYIYFWGTILRDSSGRRCVLCLYWNGDAWDWSVDWLGRGWNARSPSAVLASSSQILDTQTSSDPLNLELRIEKLEETVEKLTRVINI